MKKLLAFGLLALAACATDTNRAVRDDATPLTRMPVVDEPADDVAVATEEAVPAEPAEPAAAEPVVEVADAEPKPAEPASDAVEPAAQVTAPVTGADASVSWPKTVDSASDLVVANVGGRPVELDVLLRSWIVGDPIGVRRALDDVVLSRLIVFEGASLGVELPDGALERDVNEQLEGTKRLAQQAGAPDVETFIRGRIGIDPRIFLSEVERLAAMDLLAPRCVRTWILTTEHRIVRVITVTDDAGVDQVRARLAAGTSFEDVARDLSQDPSAEDGGLWPPLVRGETSFARRAFASEPGEVIGPFEEAGAQVFMRVEEAVAPLAGDWSVLGETVEESLAEQPVREIEFVQWKDAMTIRYGASVEPFFELAR